MKIIQKRELKISGQLFQEVCLQPIMLEIFGEVYTQRNFRIKNFIMILTRKYYLIFIFLFAQFLIKATDTLFIKADSLFIDNDFKAANIEYERIIYNTDNSQIRTRALLKKSQWFMIISLDTAAAPSICKA